MTHYYIRQFYLSLKLSDSDDQVIFLQKEKDTQKISNPLFYNGPCEPRVLIGPDEFAISKSKAALRSIFLYS